MYHKDNSGIVYRCRYHVVWCPKYKRKVLTGNVEARLKELVEKACTDQGLGLLSIEIQPDNIYLCLETSPRYGVHKAVKTLKAVTSRTLRGEFHHLTTKLPTLWTNSYFVSTDESPPWDRIREYISEQKTSQRK